MLENWLEENRLPKEKVVVFVNGLTAVTTV